MVPDYSHIVSQDLHWMPEYRTLQLVPGGYLITVNIKPINKRPYQSSEDPLYQHHLAEYQIHEWGDTEQSHGKFYWEYDLDQCGIAFQSPLVNLNAAFPYQLKRIYPESSPEVIVRITHLLVKHE